MAKTFAERIAELKYRQRQLQEQERSLLARQTVEEKKAKTKRHLRTGAAIETAIGHPVTEDDLEQINAWGLIPIVDEIIPEIDGVPPETIQPNKAAYLEKIIDKISRTAILSEKGIH